MDSTNTFKVRVQLKSDTEENWNKVGPQNGSSGFVPLLGELIIYQPDDNHLYSRLKVGDGNTNVVNLPFIDAGTIDGETLPEDKVKFYATRSLFPEPGEENKLYIDLSTSVIYCYSNIGGYTQLSHFTFTTRSTSVSRITEWSVGAMTNLKVQDGCLKAINGITPSLTYYNTDVIESIT